MRPKTTDIRKELGVLIAEGQNQIGDLQKKKSKIEKELQEAEWALSALRQVYELQAKQFGETKAPLFPKEGASYRFAGMRLGEALTVIRKEQQGIDKKQALKILEKEGFDFRGKRPLTAVHFAWMALDRKGKTNLERLTQKIVHMGRDK